ncbi:hypothetical protein B0H14DRAFT_3445792 [Mycena olivaceomarginata]|nr:hypothetical protein B0H14DRAFT_3445792 [Mycena olivaceomarginata]
MPHAVPPRPRMNPGPGLGGIATTPTPKTFNEGAAGGLGRGGHCEGRASPMRGWADGEPHAADGVCWCKDGEPGAADGLSPTRAATMTHLGHSTATTPQAYSRQRRVWNSTQADEALDTSVQRSLPYSASRACIHVQSTYLLSVPVSRIDINTRTRSTTTAAANPRDKTKGWRGGREEREGGRTYRYRYTVAPDRDVRGASITRKVYAIPPRPTSVPADVRLGLCPSCPTIDLVYCVPRACAISSATHFTFIHIYVPSSHPPILPSSHPPLLHPPTLIFPLLPHPPRLRWLSIPPLHLPPSPDPPPSILPLERCLTSDFQSADSWPRVPGGERVKAVKWRS